MLLLIRRWSAPFERYDDGGTLSASNVTGPQLTDDYDYDYNDDDDDDEVFETGWPATPQTICLPH